MRRSLLFTGLAVLALGAAIAVRTATFAPEAVADGSDVKVAEAPPIDTAAAAEHLGAAIRFQTVSNQDAARNQTAEWDRMRAWLAATYPKAHTAMNKRLVGQTLLYSWAGSDPAAQPIILMAHQDVVPVTPGTEKDWKYAPFAGTVAEGAVWGRGAIDDKGSLIALFEAMEALAAQGFQPKRTIHLVAGHDEEVGGSGAAEVARILAAEKVRALFTIDEGGVITTDTAMINAPAMMIGVAEKGYATLRVTAPAEGGHSSAPPKEIGSVNLAKAVLAIHKDQFPVELRGPGATMLEVLAARAGGGSKLAIANRWLFTPQIKAQLAASPAAEAMFHTTIAPTMLTGSPKENVLPQSATALINYRIAPWDNSAKVIERARAAVKGLPVTVEWTDIKPREPTPVSSTNSPGWKMIVASARADRPGMAFSPYLVVGGTDSRNMTAISDDVYRFMPIEIATKDIKLLHGTNEHISLKNLENQIRFFARLIATSAG